MDLIDVGANLAHDSFDDDRDVVLSEARDAGVTRIILTGSSDDSNLAASALAESHPGFLYSTAGMHPHHASDYDDHSDTLIRELVKRDHVVAVGECGLDYFRNFSPRDAQIAAFKRQLDIAEDCGKPLFLHQRDAHTDFLELVAPRLPRLGPAVAHCFTGNERELRAYIELDLYIGITGWICDERRGTNLQTIVSLISDDRLLIETDAPYLLPRTIRPRPKSRRNVPRYLPEVLRVIAECRKQDINELAELTTRNAERFFSL